MQLIKSDGSISEVKFKGKKPSLEEMQQAVGGYIEMIPTKDKRMMVINEEGKMKHLPLNSVATSMVTLFQGDFIVGDVLIGEPSLLK
jgi:hypothetical protein